MRNGSAESPSVVGDLLVTNRWAQLAELVLVFSIPACILGLAGLMESPGPLLLTAMLASAAVLMIAAVCLGLRLRGQSWHHFGVGIRKFGRRTAGLTVLQSLGAFVAALAGFVIGSALMAGVAGTPQEIEVSGYDYLQGNWHWRVLTLLGVYITASFGEEFIYRGFLMTRVAELFGGGRGAWAIALLLSSLVFGLIHYQWGATGVVQTGLMGLALGAAYLLFRRNLWVTILAHAYMDTMLILSL